MKPRRLCIGQRVATVASVPVSEQLFPALEEQPKIGIEKHFSPAQIANALSLSDTKVRRMFQNEPGVLKIGEPSRRLGRKLKRRYHTLRIPESVAFRVLARLKNR